MKNTQNSYKKSRVNISLANKLVTHISNYRKNVKKTKDRFGKDFMRIGSFDIVK